MTPVDVILPQEGMAMQAGTVTEWLKRPGDRVDEGDILAVVDAEKASFDIVSPTTGTLVEVVVEAGVEVPVLSVLARIDPT